MKNATTLILFLSISISIWADNKIDSLESLLQKDASIEQQLDLHFQLIEALKIKGEKADSLISQTISMAKANNLIYEEAYAMYYRARAANKKRNFDDDVLKDYLFADSVAHSDDEYIEFAVKVGRQTALHYFYKRDFKKAIEKMESTLNFAKQNQLSKNYSSLTINLGMFQGLDFQYFKAMDNFSQALEYPNTRKANVYWNLADLNSRLDDWDAVIHFADLSIEIAKKENQNTTEYMSAILKSNAYFELGKYEEAEALLLKYIPELKRTQGEGRLYAPYAILIEVYLASDQLEKAKALESAIPSMPYQTAYAPMATAFGKVYLEQKKYGEAISFCETSKSLSLKNMPGSAPWVADACDCLNKAYVAQKQFDKAHENLSEYQKAKDILDEREGVMNLSRALNKQELVQQETVLKLEQEKKETAYQATLSRYKWIGGFSAVIIIAAFWLANLFRKRNQKIGLQNQVISKALSEKDTLLREIHHRVKNNLQLVSSLLGLQSQHIQDPGALNALNSGKARVKSMALIHQDLYNKENLTGVSVKEYIQKLSAELISTYRIDTKKIELDLDVPDFLLDVDTLIPLGLILNELLTNSLKYAFPDNRSGKIKIKVYEDAKGLRLDFLDDGIGMDTTKRKESSFGYRLIDTLLEQLEGEMEVKNDSGTQLFFTFTDYKIAA